MCVGMQMLGRASDEGQLPGLGWIDGRVRALGALMSAETLPVPHMGWNDVRPVATNRLFDGLDSRRAVLFPPLLLFPVRPRRGSDRRRRSYGGDFACAAGAGNIFGVQFHPEKSHHYGARLLQNFAEM